MEPAQLDGASGHAAVPAWLGELRRVHAAAGSARATARRIGVSHTAVGRYLVGEREPDPELAAVITAQARALAIEPAATSAADRLLECVAASPGITTPKALEKSGASDADLGMLIKGGLLVRSRSPAVEPDALGRRRVADRLWPADRADAAGASFEADESRRASALLQRLTGDLGYAVEEIARELDVTPRAVYGYRSGRTPSRRLAALEKLAARPRPIRSLSAEEQERRRDSAEAERLCQTVEKHPGERPAAVIDRVRGLKGLNRERAERAYRRATKEGLVHERRRAYVDRAGHPRIAVEVHPGPASLAPEGPSLSGSDLAAKRTTAGLSQAGLAHLLAEGRGGVTRGAVDMWERRGVPPARVTDVLAVLEAQPPHTPIDAVAEEKAAICGIVEKDPGIGRTPLLVRRGQRVAAVRALEELLGDDDDGELVVRPVLHRRRRPHQGLYLRGAAPAAVAEPLTRDELRKLRKRAGLSQPAAAAWCSTEDEPIALPTWRQWERGVRSINQLLAPRIRERLGALPGSPAPAAGGRRRAPFDETMALALTAIGESDAGRTRTELRKACGERRDLADALKRLAELRLIHPERVAGFDTRGRAVVAERWCAGPAPETAEGAADEAVDGVELGRALGRVRRAARIGQRELVERFGVSAPTVSGWETGAHPVAPAHWPEARAFLREHQAREADDDRPG